MFRQCSQCFLCCFVFARAIFIMFLASYIVHVCSFFLCFYFKYSTTTHIQHTTYTTHNHTQHTIPTIRSTSHYITPHHITFCNSLVLILVVMASVSGQTDFSTKTKAAHCLVCSVLFFCLLVSDFCWIAWFSSWWRVVFGPERW